jgi:hypothetical protein
MNILYRPESGIADVLLQDVARKIQLPVAAYRTAQERYQTMSDWLDRDRSPLQGLISRLYGQGSIAIGAVVSSKFDHDEFDVDSIVELTINRTEQPGVVLDTLYEAIAGERGSRYHDKTVRHSRCVTVNYDEMHIDFTPAVLVPIEPQRTSVIFHANEQEAADKHYHKIANPWGFADWFKSQTPAALAFDEAVLRKVETEPLPDQDVLNEKSLPLVALQLLKRWRNKLYDDRPGRMPPSVMLAYYVGSFRAGRPTLLEELNAQAENLHRIFNGATAAGQLVKVANPRCSQDIFTDRWPANLAEQNVFTQDVKRLLGELAKLSGNPTMLECQRILGRLFGERATAIVVEEFAKRYSDAAHSGSMQHQLKTGAIALGESGLARKSYAMNETAATPLHRNFGSDPG